MKIKASILVTNYNHGIYLRQCIQAIYSQSIPPLETILVDDASTDNSKEIIHELQKEYPTLRLILNETNIGPANAMNKAILAARGEYIVLAAADDYLLPGLIEEGTKLLDSYPDAAICCSKPSMFHVDKPDSIWVKNICQSVKPLYIPPDAILKHYLKGPLWIPTHASLYRRKYVIQYGSLDNHLKHICDWYLNSKIALNHGIVYTPSSFGAFRISPQSYGSTWGRSYRKKIAVYKRLFSLLLEEPKQFQNRFRAAGVLGLIGSDVLLYLLAHIRLWKFIPHFLFRKFNNLLEKVRNQ